MKDEGIRCLFVGVADASNAEDSFKYAAEMTGGDYIITQDINEVTAKLKELENGRAENRSAHRLRRGLQPAVRYTSDWESTEVLGRATY